MPLTQQAIKQLTINDLLDRIIEESSEVIQAASKFKRFGYDNYNPFIKNAPLNIEALGLEFIQLEMLIKELYRRYPEYMLTDMFFANQNTAKEQEQKYAELGIKTGT